MSRPRETRMGMLLLAVLMAVGGLCHARPVAASADPVPVTSSPGPTVSPTPTGSPEPSPSPTPSPGLPRTLQMVVVITPHWGSLAGRLQRWQRVSLESPWLAVGKEFPVVVGRNGLAWGRGLHAPPPRASAGEQKREGDGRSPAGCFTLPEAFGFAPRSEARRFIRLPYRQLTPDTECVDDARSREYNRIVQGGRHPQRDWSSSEMMRSVSLYRWGAWVGHNDAPVSGGSGSCIFLHIWKDARSGTAGCTAMAEADLKTLLGWLEPAAQPVLVQLPRQEYDALQGAWALPVGPRASH